MKWLWCHSQKPSSTMCVRFTFVCFSAILVSKFAHLFDSISSNFTQHVNLVPTRTLVYLGTAKQQLPERNHWSTCEWERLIRMNCEPEKCHWSHVHVLRDLVLGNVVRSPEGVELAALDRAAAVQVKRREAATRDRLQ